MLFIFCDSMDLYEIKVKKIIKRGNVRVWTQDFLFKSDVLIYRVKKIKIF